MRAVPKLVLLAVLLGTLTLVGGPASAQLLPLRHYTTESESRGLPSAEVHSVHQDRQGYLWIVVYSSGLVRYDGVTMELYTEEDGLRSAALWDVAEGADGRLWATSNAGLVVSERPLHAYEGGQRVRFVSELGGVPLLEGGMRRNLIAVDGDGVVWVGTDGLGIVRYRTDGERVRTDTLRTSTSPGGPNEPVRSVVARRDGSVWAGLRGGTLLRYAGGRGPEVVSGEGAPERSVFVLYEGPDGTLWGSDQSGRLWRLAGRPGAYTFVTVSEALASAAHGIHATAAGQLFVASEGGGLLVVDLQNPTRQRVYTRQNGLLSDVVHAVTEDAEGNVWIAQSGGLSKLRYNYAAFTNYSSESAVGERALLPAPAVSAVQPVPGGGPCDVWAGTSGGGVACVRGGMPARSSYLRAQDGLSSDYVNALARDAAGRVWIGTSEGIDVVAPADVDVPTPQSQRRVQVGGEPFRVASYGGSTVLSIATLAGGPGGTWFTGYRWLFGFTGDEWFRLGEASGLPATVLHAVAADAAGHLWVGTRDQGLYRSTRPVTLAFLRSQTAAAADGEDLLGREVTDPLFEKVWSTASGAPTDQVEALLRVDGEVWVATPRGLFVLAPGRQGPPRVVARFDQDSGLLTPRVFSLDRSLATGTVWAGTNAGLVEVAPQSKRVLRRVTRRDGLIDNEVWYYGSVRTGQGGRVYFGTASGLSVYAPSQDRPNVTVPALHLRGVRFAKSAEGYNEVVLEYAATSFASEGAVQYRTRLLGYESEWSAPTTEAKIRYTNLPAVFFPKTYTFEVVAHNGSGVWTPGPLTYAFQVQPPWWLRWWAFLVYAAVAVGGVVAVVRAQRARLLRQVRQRARIREAEHQAEQAAAEQAAAEARARALQAENDRKEVELQKAHELEQAYHELQATQAQLVQAEKMASLGQLTAGIAHEIKNPLNFVNNFAKASIELVDELREELAVQGGDGSAPDGSVEYIMGDLAMMATKIAEHGDRADRIVKSMLQHSRGGGGGFQDVKVNTFVDEYVNLAFHGTRAHDSDFNVDIVRDYDEAVSTVEAVPQELGRVLINLLNNAFYAVHEQKGRLGPPYEPRVSVSTRQLDDAVEIRVGDNGPGIPAAVRERVFEPFFTTKPTGEGTGLGLSLSYDVVTQMHGGSLQLETAEGDGTTFIITLPTRAAGRGTAARADDSRTPAALGAP